MDKKIKIFIFVLIFLYFVNFSSGAYSSSYMNQPANYQAYYSGSAGENLGSRINTYWSALDDPDQCRARQDVVLQVAPAGCSPSVVRSDLLAEQNVAVFCQVNALQLNPLIEIDKIDNIRFSGNKYPLGVVGAGFHPLRAAIRSRGSLMGSPLINNIGYVVVVLKKNANESSLPNYINLTLKGILEYDAGNAFGLGKYEFILNEETDAEWEFTKNKQSFFRGNYFLKLERAEPEYALVSVYQGDRKLYTIRVEKSKTSNDIYLPGFYCQAALKFEYSGFEAAQKSARIEVSDSKGTETFDMYERSSFLDGKCSVREIKIDGKGENGNVTIACDNNNKIILALKPRGAEFAVGDEAYYNSGKSGVSDIKVKIISISNDNIYNVISDGGYTSMSVLSSSLKAIEQTAPKTKYREAIYSSETDDAFNAAIAEYERVANEYPADKKRDESNITYAEESLVKAKDLAKDFGKTQTRYRILNRLIKEYYDSPSISDYKNELSYLDAYDTSYSETLALINNDYKTIKLIGLTLPKKASSLTFGLSTNPSGNTAGKAFSDSIIITGEYSKVNADIELSAEIEKIESDRVSIIFKCPAKTAGASTTTSSVIISTNKYESQSSSICGVPYLINYRDSNIERVARIKIYPKAMDSRTETNLSVAIGIEKRAIKLNPEKTKERIDAINDSIKKWESMANNLGKAVKGLKAACFATSAALTVKNFFVGLDGTALARQKVMQEMGWSERCKLAYQEKTVIKQGQTPYSSIDDCFFQNKDLIDSQIEAAKNAISKDNADIGAIISKKGNSREGSIFSGKQAIYDNVAADYLEKNADVINTALSMEGITRNDNSSLSYEKAKEVVFYDNLIKSGKLDETSKKQIEDKLNQIKNTVESNKKREEVYSKLDKTSALKNVPLNVYVDKEKAQRGYWDGSTFDKSGFKFDTNLEYQNGELVLKESDKVAFVSIGADNYLVKIGEASVSQCSDCYSASEVYKVNLETKLVSPVSSSEKKNEVLNKFPIFQKVNEATYRNVYQGAEVRYFETDPYKGIPEVVPIDIREGWYAGIRNDIPLMGAKSNVDASGAVASFWLCNVNKDGREEFRKDGFGNDICKRFDFYTGQSLDDFPGISDKNKVNRLVSTAVNSIREAQQQYKTGMAAGKTIKINGEEIKVGNPALTVSGSNCQDFMSASDCNILFNVCDPVICPNTRCNLGGQFYVQDVVQSGIVGSALLCLPNFGNPAEGGVAIPVCLSGLKAGVDGYLSIMKSHRDCLQKNVDTGQMVGICDQLYSIYLCDFFWKQIAPAVNVLLPKLIEFAVSGGQKARGGGEYMSVMFAWENAQKSVDYFTQSYAANSFKAFNLRNTQDVGEQVCKSFVSTKLPTNIKSLLEPDSPFQFYAYFDSSTLSTATVPATAQYKVYYHIFAGNDFGAYYSVYMKDAPQTSFYISNPTIPVASGFIAKGQSADESRDFSAPEGYKQLCVKINDEEKCGFKQVTTDFGINYLSNKVVADEITEKGITSESGCISGGGLANGVSSTTLLNPNLQSLAESATDSKVYERGIVRVCATDNPANSTNPSRYVQVGYCDASQKVKCWLDKKSVDNALVEGDIGTRNATLSELGTINKEYLDLNGKLIDSEVVLSKIQALEKSVKDLISNEIKKKGQGKFDMNLVKDNLSEIDNLLLNGDASDAFLYNSQKARLLQMKGDIREAIARNYLKSIAQSNVVKSIASGTTVIPPVKDQNGNVIVPSISEKLEKSLVEVKKRNGKYSANKIFVDELYNNGNGILTKEEYNEITGGGIFDFNLEEDMKFIEQLITRKIYSNPLYLNKYSFKNQNIITATGVASSIILVNGQDLNWLVENNQKTGDDKLTIIFKPEYGSLDGNIQNKNLVSVGIIKKDSSEEGSYKIILFKEIFDEEISRLSPSSKAMHTKIFNDLNNAIIRNSKDIVRITDALFANTNLLTIGSLESEGIKFKDYKVYLNNVPIGTVNSNTNVINVPTNGISICEKNSVSSVCSDINGKVLGSDGTITETKK